MHVLIYYRKENFHNVCVYRIIKMYFNLTTSSIISQLIEKKSITLCGITNMLHFNNI